jgi:hypothetical protein
VQRPRQEEPSSPKPESFFTDPAYGCVDWYEYQPVVKKNTSADGGA